MSKIIKTRTNNRIIKINNADKFLTIPESVFGTVIVMKPTDISGSRNVATREELSKLREKSSVIGKEKLELRGELEEFFER